MQRLAVATTPMGVGFAALALRAVAGAVVAYHGYQKVDRGVGNFAASVTDLQVFGLNLPFLAGYLVVVVELVGGLCLLAGLATRVWSILVAIQFMAIPFVVKSDVGLVAPRGQGTGFELDLLVAACARGPAAHRAGAHLPGQGAAPRTAMAGRRRALRAPGRLSPRRGPGPTPEPPASLFRS